MAAKVSFHGAFGSKAAAQARLASLRAGGATGEIRPTTMRGQTRYAVVTRASNPRRRGAAAAPAGGGPSLVELLLLGGLGYLAFRAVAAGAADAAAFDQAAFDAQRAGERLEGADA